MDDDIIASRVALGEKPLLTNIVKRFFLLAAADEASAATTGEALLRDLDVLEVELNKARAVHVRADEQLALYADAGERIETARAAVAGDVDDLRSRLAAERVKRKNNEEYDMLASKLADLPPRAQTQAALADVESALAALDADAAVLADKKARRAKQFSLLLFAIDELQRELSSETAPPSAPSVQ